MVLPQPLLLLLMTSLAGGVGALATPPLLPQRHQATPQH
jgi:hypothetical protein